MVAAATAAAATAATATAAAAAAAPRLTRPFPIVTCAAHADWSS